MTRMKKRDLFPVIWSVLFFVFIINSWCNTAYSSQVKKPIIKNDLVPLNLLKWGKDASEHLVLVDKDAQKVMVYKGDNIFSPEKIYNCSTGENEGPKTRLNDRKTPEGIYYFTDSYIDRYLAPIYGVRAFPISYPNFLDKKEGKDGYGIWFHGTNKPLKPNDTNGCIAMANPDIDDFAAHVKLFDTPIIIAANIEMVPFKRLEKDAKELTEIVEGWRQAWQDKDMDGYISYYHKDFTSGSKDRDQWKQYKSELAKKYRNIGVNIHDLELLSNNGIILARFNQEYRSDTLFSNGIKSLYFKKNSDKWKIIGEFFTGKDKVAIPPERPPVMDKVQVENLIYSWLDAWENKDLDRYISFYGDGFLSRGMDISAWKMHRDKLNKRYDLIDIRIDDLKIKEETGSRTYVSFKQDYRADNFRDYGLKEMVLEKEAGDWKIKEEDWTPIRR